MSGTANVLCTVGEGGRAMLPLARRETPRSSRRIPAADQLIAPPCEVVLPTLEKVPTEQRFSADDREVITLAEILVKSDIAGRGRLGEERKRRDQILVADPSAMDP